MISNSEIIFLMLSLGLLVFGVVVGGVWFYMIFFKMPEIVSSLARSLVVKDRVVLLSAGLVGKFYILSGVSGVLVFPKRSIEKGELDLEDYRQFPKTLKLWIVCSTSASIGIALVGVIMALVIQFLAWPSSGF